MFFYNKSSRWQGIAGKADTFTLYAYDKENKLKEVPAELWHIQEEDGTLPDKLTEDTLYEVHVMVEDGGEFDLSDTEKEIKIAVILGNKWFVFKEITWVVYHKAPF